MARCCRIRLQDGRPWECTAHLPAAPTCRNKDRSSSCSHVLNIQTQQVKVRGQGSGGQGSGVRRAGGRGLGRAGVRRSGGAGAHSPAALTWACRSVGRGRCRSFRGRAGRRSSPRAALWRTGGWRCGRGSPTAAWRGRGARSAAAGTQRAIRP